MPERGEGDGLAGCGFGITLDCVAAVGAAL